MSFTPFFEMLEAAVIITILIKQFGMIASALEGTLKRLYSLQRVVQNC